MRGNEGNALGSASCPCDSPPDRSIPSSMKLPWERNGPAAAPSNHLGGHRVPLSPRVASPYAPYINWNCGGRDDVYRETRLADCPGRGDIRRGNRGRLVVSTQRCGTEPLRPAENRAARGRVQIQRPCLELRSGKSH